MPQWLSSLAALYQRTWAPFPGPIEQLTIIWNSNFKDSNTLLLCLLQAPSMWCRNIQAGKINTQTHRIQNYLKMTGGQVRATVTAYHNTRCLLFHLFFFFLKETGFLYLALTVLELLQRLSQPRIQRDPAAPLLSAGIKGMHHCPPTDILLTVVGNRPYYNSLNHMTNSIKK